MAIVTTRLRPRSYCILVVNVNLPSSVPAPQPWSECDGYQATVIP